jgi:hypothetical protein
MGDRLGIPGALGILFLQNFVSIISIYETVKMKLAGIEKQRSIS